MPDHRKLDGSNTLGNLPHDLIAYEILARLKNSDNFELHALLEAAKAVHANWVSASGYELARFNPDEIRMVRPNFGESARVRKLDNYNSVASRLPKQDDDLGPAKPKEVLLVNEWFEEHPNMDRKGSTTILSRQIVLNFLGEINVWQGSRRFDKSEKIPEWEHKDSFKVEPNNILLLMRDYLEKAQAIRSPNRRGDIKNVLGSKPTK